MYKSKIFSERSLTAMIIATLSVLGFLFAFSFASAHTDPGGCTDSGVGISLSIFRNDEVTVIGGGQTIAPGETIKYRATLSALGLPNCNFSGGALSITTPDGTTNVTPGGGIPLVSPGSPFVSAFVPYVVDAADIGGDGDIDASTTYTAGESHTGVSHDVASGSVTRQTPVEARVIVVKQTTPDGSTQDFEFNPSWSESNFMISDGEESNSGVLTPGAHSVAEVNLPAGWTLTNTACVSSIGDTEAAGSLDLDAGEVITCTFTNTQSGIIIVDKVSSPSSETDFTFDSSWTTDFVLDDTDAPHNSGNLTPGTYSVSEINIPAGWSLTNTACTSSLGGSENAASIGLTAGETVTCVFTNTEQMGNIIIEKQTIPDGSSQVFDFNLSYGDNDADLSDGQQDNSGPLAAGTYSAAETVIAGWDLTSAICSDQSPVNAISLQAGETVTCVFTNTQQPGRIIVEKQTSPDASPVSFEFDSSYGSNFNLIDGGQNDSGNLSAGTYSVAEVNIPLNWTLSNVTCNDGSTPVSISLQAGETVTCVFTNTFTPPAVQGCSPGYWKQSQHYGSYPEGIFPNTLFVTVFGEDAFPGKSLVQVLGQGGGGLNALGRIIVGAYLNASTVAGFPYTPAQVIADFQAVHPGGDYNALKAKYEALQDPCPFGRNPGSAGPTTAAVTTESPSNNGKSKKNN
jgi:hypothetical protein